MPIASAHCSQRGGSSRTRTSPLGKSNRPRPAGSPSIEAEQASQDGATEAERNLGSTAGRIYRSPRPRIRFTGPGRGAPLGGFPSLFIVAGSVILSG